jgi:hypothetical protein
MKARGMAFTKNNNMKARGSAGLQTEKDKEPTQESLPPPPESTYTAKEDLQFRKPCSLDRDGNSCVLFFVFFCAPVCFKQLL